MRCLDASKSSSCYFTNTSPAIQRTTARHASREASEPEVLWLQLHDCDGCQSRAMLHPDGWGELWTKKSLQRRLPASSRQTTSIKHQASSIKHQAPSTKQPSITPHGASDRICHFGILAGKRTQIYSEMIIAKNNLQENKTLQKQPNPPSLPINHQISSKSHIISSYRDTFILPSISPSPPSASQPPHGDDLQPTTA